MFLLWPLHKLVFRSRRNGTTRWELPGDAVTQSINSIEDNPVNYTIFAASMCRSVELRFYAGSSPESFNGRETNPPPPNLPKTAFK